jgi:hypothetical protein
MLPKLADKLGKNGDLPAAESCAFELGKCSVGIMSLVAWARRLQIRTVHRRQVGCLNAFLAVTKPSRKAIERAI